MFVRNFSFKEIGYDFLFTAPFFYLERIANFKDPSLDHTRSKTL